MISRRWFLGALAMTCAGTAAAGARAGEAPLRIGVAPHTSARIILEMYQPLREELQSDLGIPVEIITAPDFTEYVRRALAQEYDIAITTGHQARLLQTDGGYQPLVTYSADFRSVIVVPKDSPARRAKDLDHTTVIGLSPTSLVTLWGDHWLKRGDTEGIQIRYVSAADSVAQLVLAGDATAGMMSLPNFQGLAPDVRARLRFLVESEPMPGRVYMLNARWSQRREEILRFLAAFAASKAGQDYFSSKQLEGYRPIRPGELEAVDPYAREVRAELRRQAP